LGAQEKLKLTARWGGGRSSTVNVFLPVMCYFAFSTAGNLVENHPSIFNLQKNNSQAMRGEIMSWWQLESPRCLKLRPAANSV
jgi:hypothetical protein